MDISVGCRIRNIRGKESRSAFAEKLGIGTTTLQRYENDERSPELDVLIKLQALTGYSLDFLVYGKAESINDQDLKFLDKYRKADSETRNKILMLLLDVNATSVDANANKNSRVHNSIDDKNETVDSAVYSDQPSRKVKAEKIGVVSENGKVKIGKLEM